MGYSDPNSVIRREHAPTAPAGGTATTSYNKFRSFQRFKLIKAHAVVTVAGTNAGHGFDVYSGTTSVGRINLGTGAANTKASSNLINAVVESLDEISIKSLVDATGTAQVIYEYQVLPDAVQS